MKRLTDDLKRVLAGLAHQDAGEFLSAHDKMKELGIGSETRANPSPPPREPVIKPATRRIALIMDGREVGASLDYAIESCLRQNAKIDLLIHGAVDTANIYLLENQIRSAGIENHRIPLGGGAVDDIVSYIENHPSLIFLIAKPDDIAATEIIEEVIPRHGGRIPVPLVLIGNQTPTRQTEQSAA